VDDDRDLARQVRDLLRFNGYDVVVAHDGEAGLTVLQTEFPDLVLLDINMPQLGGIGFLKRFRETPLAVRPAILVFTARVNMGDFFDGVDVAGFLSKPCDDDTLLRAVNDVMAQRRSSGAPKTSSPLAKSRVLLAVDDTESARRIANALGATDFMIERASTGPEALERALMHKPDLLIAKVILTGMNGDALASALSDMPTTSGIPIVLYDDSGRDEPEEKYVTGKNGVRAFVRGNDVYELASVAKGVLA